MRPCCARGRDCAAESSAGCGDGPCICYVVGPHVEGPRHRAAGARKISAEVRCEIGEARDLVDGAGIIDVLHFIAVRKDRDAVGWGCGWRRVILELCFTNVVKCIAVHVEVGSHGVCERCEGAVGELNETAGDPAAAIDVKRQTWNGIANRGGRDVERESPILQHREVGIPIRQERTRHL